MVQRSAREEDSLVSQRKEYENMLSQQRGLYGEKMTELEKLHSQRKVIPVVYGDKNGAKLTYLMCSSDSKFFGGIANYVWCNYRAIGTKLLFSIYIMSV